MAGQRKSKKKILVCGGTGFIGRNIVEHLAANPEFDVFATFYHQKPFGNCRNRFLKADLTKQNDVAMVIKDKDIVIQAAATTSGAKDIISRPYYHVTDNAIMNSLILRAAYEQKIKHLVFFSCTIMYPSGGKPVKESSFDPDSGIYPSYFGAAWTKVYIEKMCEFYSRLGRTKHTVLRHSNIYGPYDKFDLEKSHVFGATIAKVMASSEKVFVWGEGKSERDLLYVSDLVDCVATVIKKQREPFELFNVGSGESVSVRDLVRRIIYFSGKKMQIKYDRSKPDIKTKVCLDVSKIKKTLGWERKIRLDEGIKKTLAWYKDNILIAGKGR